MQVSSWQRVILTDLQRCVQYMLSLLPAAFRNSDQQRLWQLRMFLNLNLTMLVLNGCKSSTLLIEGCVCVCASPVAKGASVKSCYR